MEAVSSMRPARAREPQAGYNADLPCIQRRKPATPKPPKFRFASRRAALLFRLRRIALWRSLTRRLLRRRLRHVHLLSLLKRIRGINHDLIRGRNATKNLQRSAVIAS